MFGKIVVGTYLQDCCMDRRFMGEHITIFWMKKRDASKLVKRRMGFRSLRDFLKRYTFDDSEQLYILAKRYNQVRREWIERA